MHPDFATDAAGWNTDSTTPSNDRLDPDQAVNFVEMGQVVARMRAAFFSSSS